MHTETSRLDVTTFRSLIFFCVFPVGGMRLNGVGEAAGPIIRRLISFALTKFYLPWTFQAKRLLEAFISIDHFFDVKFDVGKDRLS